MLRKLTTFPGLNKIAPQGYLLTHMNENENHVSIIFPRRYFAA